MVDAMERRMMHLLNAKDLKFQVVFVDIDTDKLADMEAASGSKALPQLHVHGEFVGDYTTLQDLEDGGALDKEFVSRNIPIKAAPPVPKPTLGLLNADTRPVSAAAGAVKAFATSKFVKVSWNAAAPLLPPHVKPFWVLKKDGEPVYIGHSTEYIVPISDPAPAVFEVIAADSEGASLPISDPNALPPVHITPPGGRASGRRGSTLLVPTPTLSVEGGGGGGGVGGDKDMPLLTPGNIATARMAARSSRITS